MTNHHDKQIKNLLKKVFSLYATVFFFTFLTPASATPSTEDVLKGLGIEHTKLTTLKTVNSDAIIKKIESDPLDSRSGLTFAWIEVKSKYPKAHAQQVLRYGSSYQIISSASPPSAIAVINGGFFGYNLKGDYMPLGLLISQGDKKNSKASWKSGGIFYQKQDGSIKVDPSKINVAEKEVKTAIQSKPILVYNGKIAIYSDDGERFDRTAIVITKAQEIIIAGAFESFGRALTMKEFAKFIASIKSSTGASVDVALAMDGGPGSQLYVPSLKLHFGDPGKNFVPNLVYFTN